MSREAGTAARSQRGTSASPSLRGAHPAGVPSTASAVWTLAGITLVRLGRGKGLWIGAVIAGVQVLYAVAVRARPELASPLALLLSSMPLLALLPAIFVGASVGEELDERTSTYLWSRPLARWVVLAGKLCALAPIVIALVVGGWVAAIALSSARGPSLASCVALAAGASAASLVAAGIATVMPRHAMAMTIGYMLIDTAVGLIPFSLRELSITHQTVVIASLSSEPGALTTAVVAMAVVAAAWVAIAALRIRRLEV